MRDPRWPHWPTGWVDLEEGRGGLVEPEAQASALYLCLFCDFGLVIPQWASVSSPVQPHKEVGSNAVRDLLMRLFDHSQFLGFRPEFQGHPLLRRKAGTCNGPRQPEWTVWVFECGV